MDLAALMQLPPGGLEIGLLVLIRVSALFVVAPIFGNQMVPVRFRVGLAVLFTLLILPLELAGPHPTLADADAWTLAIARELAVGLMLGFLAMLFFYGVQLAGHMIGLQMGFGMSQMFDPSTHGQTSELSVLLTMLATVAFLQLDGHHWLLAAVWKSFQAVPLASFTPTASLIGRMVGATTGIFDTALTLMLPISGVLLVIELALAILNRVSPQMNVFALGMGAKILLGIATLAVTLPLFGATLDVMIDRAVRQITDFF